jgi:hypothetical protein
MRRTLPIAALGAVVALMSHSAASQAGLIGYWPLDGDYLDATGNGNDGATVGSPAFDANVPPAIGAGSSVLLGGPIFDTDGTTLLGGDAVDVGNDASLNFGTGDWTISAWVYTTGHLNATDNEKGTVFGNGGDTGGGKRYAVIVSESVAGVPTVIVDDDVNKYTQNATSVVNDGVWRHVTALRDGTRINIYVDGIREGSNDFGNASYDLSGTVQYDAYIGAVTAHNNGIPYLYKYFKGNIDDVALYDERLQGNQIAYLAGGGSPTSLPAGIPGSDLLPPPPGPYGPAPGPVVLAVQNFDDPGYAYSTAGEGVSDDGAKYWTTSDTEGLDVKRPIEQRDQGVFWLGSKANDGGFGGGVDPRVLELDPIDVAGLTGLVLNVSLAASFQGDWESDDYLRILADLDGAGPEDALTLAEFRGEQGPAGKNLANVADPTIAIENVFARHGFSIPDGATDLVVRFEFHSTSDTEIVAIDDITVTAVPEPSTLAMLGLALLGGLFVWPRRRRG